MKKNRNCRIGQRSSLRRWLVPVMLVLAGVVLVNVATAQEQKDGASGSAADLIAAGEQAARLGEYDFAVQALEQALRIERRPQLWLTVADVYRQRFLSHGAGLDRLKALSYYEAYLEALPTGSQSQGARAKLAELEARKSAGDDSAEPPQDQTRLAVTATIMGATARVDEAAAQKLPLFVTVKPGKHTVVVSAEGYEDQSREIDIDEGFVYAVRADLDPAAAKLTVDTTHGAEVHLDGHPLGIAPFDEPVDVEPGTAILSVRANGFHPHSEEVTLERGESHDLAIDLAMTRQRMGGIFLAAAGGAAVVAGVIFGVAAMLTEPARGEPLEPAEEAALLAQVDDYRVLSAMTAGIGFGLSAFGGVLLIFDEPPAMSPKEQSQTVVSVTPRAGPGQAGAALTVAF